jgi:hypothetical protein
MNNRILTRPGPLPARVTRFTAASLRRASAKIRTLAHRGPARDQVATAQDRGLRFMKAIWHRAQAPFFSSAPQLDQPAETIHPRSLARL